MSDGFRVRTAKCDTCLYAVAYPKETRDRILGQVEADDSFVKCHAHDLAANVCCHGYWTSVGQRGGTPVQLAIRFDLLGVPVVEWVGPEMYPPPDGDEEEDDR